MKKIQEATKDKNHKKVYEKLEMELMLLCKKGQTLRTHCKLKIKFIS